MKKKERLQNQELRSEIRQAAAQGAVVEFKPSEDAMIHQLALRDWSASGLGILVRKDSQICRRLKVGQVVTMTLHRGMARSRPEHLRVEVRHISEPAPGQHSDHCIIGLYIRGRLSEEEMA